jgi:hypothetical protein
MATLVNPAAQNDLRSLESTVAQMPGLSPVVKEALRLDALYGDAEAARRTGVPRYALRMWRRRLGLPGPEVGPRSPAGRSAPPALVVDAYLRFRRAELTELRQRALDGCRGHSPFLDPADGLCIKCGRVCSWGLWLRAMYSDLVLVTAGSAETDHDRDPEAVYV